LISWRPRAAAGHAPQARRCGRSRGRTRATRSRGLHRRHSRAQADRRRGRGKRAAAPEGGVHALPRMAGATAAFGTDPELLAQLAQTAHAFVDGLADVAFGYRVADANVHVSPSKLDSYSAASRAAVIWSG